MKKVLISAFLPSLSAGVERVRRYVCSRMYNISWNMPIHIVSETF